MTETCTIRKPFDCFLHNILPDTKDLKPGKEYYALVYLAFRMKSFMSMNGNKKFHFLIWWIVTFRLRLQQNRFSSKWRIFIIMKWQGKEVHTNTGNVLIALGLNFRFVLRCCSSDTKISQKQTKNLPYQFEAVAALIQNILKNTISAGMKRFNFPTILYLYKGWYGKFRTTCQLLPHLNWPPVGHPCSHPPPAGHTYLENLELFLPLFTFIRVGMENFERFHFCKSQYRTFEHPYLTFIRVLWK